ncbi:MAG: SpoIIE family protein phosphatase [bacterium]
MNFFEKHSWLFRILLLSLAIIFIYIILLQLTGRQTDQNSFTGLKNFLYVNKNLVVYNDNGKVDTLNSFDCIMEIDSKAVVSPEIFKSIADDSKKFHQIKVLHLPDSALSIKKIQKDNLVQENFMFFSSGIYIFSVQKNGTSYKAGVRKGDLLLRINNYKTSDPVQADNIIRNNTPEKLIKYDIIRNGTIKSYYVELAKITLKVYFVIFIITGFIFLITSLFIGLNRPKLKSARLTSLALAMFGFVLVVSFGSLSSPSSTAAVITFLFMGILAYFWMPVSIHSLFYFPTEYITIPNKKWLIRFPYFLIILCIVSRFLLTVFGSEFDKTFTIFNYLLVFYLIYLLFYIYKITPPNLRHILKAPYIGWLLFCISYIIIGIVGTFVIKSPAIAEKYLYLNYILLSSVFIPLAYIYSISKNSLFKLRMKMRRNIKYLLISFIYKLILFVGLAYVIHLALHINVIFPSIRFTYTTIEYLEKPLRPALQVYYSKLLAILFSLVGIYFYRKFVKLGQKILDDIFYRVHVDFRQLSAQMHQLQQNDIEANKLADNFIKTLSHGMKLKHGGILFIGDNNEIVVQKYYGFKSNTELREFISLISKDLICETMKHKDPFSTSLLNDNIKSVFDEYQIEYIVPAISKDKYHGIILIGEKLSESTFNTEELSFMKDIADHASVVIENALLYQKSLKQERLNHELELARQIQYNSLPQSNPKIDCFDIYGLSAPAYEVGGDFYDYFHEGNYLDVIIGDVAGKGTSAAMYMSNAIGIIRTLQKFSLNPKQILINLNELMSNNLSKNSFITALCGRFDIAKKTLTISRAGHIPLYHYNSLTNSVEKLIPKGIAIGVVDTPSFTHITEEMLLPYNTGDIFLFVTDGIIEARGYENEELGESLIYKHIKNQKLTANQLIQNIIIDINNIASENPQFDDITAVAIKII